MAPYFSPGQQQKQFKPQWSDNSGPSLGWLKKQGAVTQTCYVNHKNKPKVEEVLYQKVYSLVIIRVSVLFSPGASYRWVLVSFIVPAKRSS
jgi:hypothetical protein